MNQEGKIKYIAVAGNIGAGKTTLVHKLHHHYGWIPSYEEIENNPYIEDFYNDMVRWSFNLQIFFLQKRIRQIIDVLQSNAIAILDRTIYEDIYIFATNLRDMGLMSVRDFENYAGFYDTLKKFIQPPDLLIYLKASVPTLVKQITRRGRIYETKINIDYLEKLNTYYTYWISQYKGGQVLTIDVDNNDFENNPEDLWKIIAKIDTCIHGLL